MLVCVLLCCFWDVMTLHWLPPKRRCGRCTSDYPNLSLCWVLSDLSCCPRPCEQRLERKEQACSSHHQIIIWICLAFFICQTQPELLQNWDGNAVWDQERTQQNVKLGQSVKQTHPNVVSVWNKRSKMQPVWLPIFSGKQFEDSHEERSERIHQCVKLEQTADQTNLFHEGTKCWI